MSAPSRIVDHLVIGGGPAGAMAAISLARAGRQVVLVEKERRPHDKVCGEFLSREAVDYLRRILVDPESLGAAPIHRVRFCGGSKVAEAALPFRALSISRRLLDQALLARVEEASGEVRRGTKVESLVADGDGWLVAFGSGDRIRARTVFLASGKHDVRDWNRGRGKQDDLIGFKLHWRLDPVQVAELREAIELFAFPGGYGGLSLIEEEKANLCLVVRRSKLRQAGGWNGVFSAVLNGSVHLRRRVRCAEPQFAHSLAISPIPYGYMAAQSCGLWRVGDQAAVIPSFTGDGMSIALHSAALAAEMFLEGRSADEYLRTLREQLRGPMRLATLLSRAMVTAAGRTAAPAALSLLPNAIGWIVAGTRVPERAMVKSDPADACETAGLVH